MVPTSVDITGIRMLVTVAGYTSGECPTMGRVSTIPWCAGLTELAHVPCGACALLNPGGCFSESSTASGGHLDIVNDAHS